MATKTIRWVLSHHPLEIFLRAAKTFAHEVFQASNGELEVEILTLEDYINKYNNGVSVDYPELVEHLNTGKFEISQMYTTILGKYATDMRVLDLPFLFTDNDHAARVLDGRIGRNILSGLALNEHTNNIKGLSFTYSGGFTVIGVNKDINSIEDLAGLKLRVPTSPVIRDYFTELGTDPVMMMDIEEIATAMNSKAVDGAEITYRRLYEFGVDVSVDQILHSNHNLFLTSIILNTDFWNTLSQDMQTIISDAALVAARGERADAIEDDVVHRAKCLDDGIVVKTMSAELEQEFRDRSINVYAKYQDYFSPGLVNKIKSA
jgi:TRAP-type C4-dicarboxylate transport system substrate-binding protein